VPEPIRRATDILRHETDRRAVLAGDREFARWAGGLGARRILHMVGHRPKDDGLREQIESIIVARDETALVLESAARYGITHIAITHELLRSYPGLRLEQIGARPHMRRLFFAGDPDGEFLALFAIRGAALR
jgi:hypothetical protein